MHAQAPLCLPQAQQPVSCSNLASAGAYSFLDQDDTQRRRQGVKLNIPPPPKPTRQDPTPQAPPRSSRDEAPASKTNEDFKDSAQRGDAKMAVETPKRQHPIHDRPRTATARNPTPAKLCIVWGSHALMKLPYWDEAGFKQPDPMHTLQNEVIAN